MTWPLLLPIFMLGLVAGSFLNVVIYRVPRGESVVRPSSHCRECKRSIRHRHNIPVVSWLLLRGRCSDCRSPISPRYPLVESATGLLFVAVAIELSRLNLLAALPAYLYFAAAGLALSVIDFECRRLPDAIVLPSYPVLAVLLTSAAVVKEDWSALVRSGIGAVALFLFYFAIALIHPTGLGLGDVKLAGLVGGMLAYASWPALVVGAFAGFLLGALAGIAMMVIMRGDRKTAIPFGPFMIAGALLALPVAAPITQSYLDLILA